MLDAGGPGDDRARRAREIAGRQVAHLGRLVEDLLDVTRITHGKIELRRASVDLAAIARSVAEDHRQLAHARGLSLEVEAPGPAPVSGDATRLAQVIGNLLSNACKFTPRGGRIALSVRAAGGDAIVSVRDTGVGIAPELLGSVFDPFVQGDQTLARREGGLGLGLALVKGLVELHGGAIGARSEGPGRGTEVAFSVPLAAARPAAAPPATPGRRAAPAARRRVLVVDDNRDAADSLAALVELLGHEAVVAYDGPAALAASRAQAPNLVLCDIGLDGMDGYEVARRLRAGDAAGARLVALSGYARPQDVARAVEAGFDAHVAKPLDPDALAALLR